MYLLCNPTGAWISGGFICPGPLLLFFLFFKILFYVYERVHCSCLLTHQKRASDLITDDCEPPCGCWELNSGPLEEQSVLNL